MKKKVLATLLLSTVFLSQSAHVVAVSAETTEDKIEATNDKIKEISTKQNSAEKELEEAQTKVSSIQKEQENLQSENEKLQAVSKDLEKDITELSKNIVSRSSSLEEQARSAQTSGVGTSYIDTIVNSDSISEAISRVMAMTEIVSANNKMLEQQKADKEAILKKQETNNNAINTVIANQNTLDIRSQELTTKQAELKVAELGLAVEKASVESEKEALLEQKAQAEAEVKVAEEAEKAYKEEKQAQEAVVSASATTSLAAQIKAVEESTPSVLTTSTTPEVVATSESNSVSEDTPAVSEEVVETKSTPKAHPKYNSDASSYPMGECTWGAKTLAPWAGDYWGNGAQWATSAAAAGFRTGSTPQVGAIACWNDGGYGHVAVVTAVESANRIQVSESNYGGKRYIGNHRGWFNPTTTSEGFVTYIYAD